MSRLTIDTGTEGNPATGDSLRGAFTKVNTNFAELYAELGGDSLDAISFTNNTISTDITNANLILTGNGTGGVVIEDIEITGSTVNVLTTNNNLTLNTNGTGKVIINGLSFPTADGTAGQVLKTDGAGNLSFTAVDPGAITFVGDDSTGTAVNIGETFKIAGGTGLTSAVSGDTITLDIDSTVTTLTGSQELTNKTITLGSNTISGTAAQFNTGVVDTDFATLDGSEVLTNKTISTASNTITGTVITLVGDDSSGTAVNIGETFKIAGTQNITTAVSGDTLTITGPNLSSYLTNSPITFVGDDSTGVTLNSGETIKIAGTQNITTAVSGDTLTITGPNLSSYLTAVPSTIAVNEISSSDSSAIQINDAVNISGALTFHGAGLTFPDATTQTTAFTGNAATVDITNTNGIDTNYSITFVESRDVTQYLRADVDLTFNSATNLLTAGNIATNTIVVNELSSADSSAIQINDAVNVSGAGTFHGSVRFNAGYTEKINALTSSSTITVDCALASIHTVTLAVSTGFVVSNLPTGGTVTLIITQGGSGSYTATFGTDGSTTVKFPGGAPTLSTAVGAIDVVTIFNDGTNYLGNIAKAYAA